jgi:hypothetical protein
MTRASDDLEVRLDAHRRPKANLRASAPRHPRSCRFALPTKPEQRILSEVTWAIRGMSTKMCALNSTNGAVQGPYIGDTIGPKPTNRTNNLRDHAKRPDGFDRGLGSPHDMKA